MADLKTDYKDDVLDTTQNTKRKYQMIDNGDGTVSFEDVTEYLQQGDSFGANDINDTNEEINDINDNLTCEEYAVSGASITLAEAINNWTEQANMSVGETRRIDMEFSDVSGHPNYVIEITKTKNYNNDDVYTGWMFGTSDVENRRNFLKVGNTVTIQVINSYGGSRIGVPVATGITYKSAAQQLYTVWQTLSVVEKRNSVIVLGNYILTVINTVGYFSYTMINAENKIVNLFIDLSTGSVKRLIGTTLTDISNYSLESAMALVSYPKQTYTPS